MGYSPCIVPIFGNFQNALIFPILAVFSSRFLHRTTLMCLYKRFWHVKGNFIFWPKLSILRGLWPLRKIPQNRRKTSLQTHISWKETANIRIIWPFWKLPKMATMQRLYSPSKILSLGQNIKLLKTCEECLYKHVKVLLCKKRLQKQLTFKKLDSSKANCYKMVDFGNEVLINKKLDD